MKFAVFDEFKKKVVLQAFYPLPSDWHEFKMTMNANTPTSPYTHTHTHYGQFAARSVSWLFELMAGMSKPTRNRSPLRQAHYQFRTGLKWSLTGTEGRGFHPQLCWASLAPCLCGVPQGDFHCLTAIMIIKASSSRWRIQIIPERWTDLYPAGVAPVCDWHHRALLPNQIVRVQGRYPFLSI